MREPVGRDDTDAASLFFSNKNAENYVNIACECFKDHRQNTTKIKSLHVLSLYIELLHPSVFLYILYFPIFHVAFLIRSIEGLSIFKPRDNIVGVFVLALPASLRSFFIRNNDPSFFSQDWDKQEASPWLGCFIWWRVPPARKAQVKRIVWWS